MEYLYLNLLVLPFVWMCFLGITFFFRIKLTENFLSESVKWISLIMSSLSLSLVRCRYSWLYLRTFDITAYRDYF